MSESDGQRPTARRTRADALRNREQILRAATDLVIEHSPAPPMELIARRAKVGIATLYRHFPDRPVLLRQVALDTLRKAAEAARSALAEEPDAFTALARYLHQLVTLKVGAVMPVLADRIPADEELRAARHLSREAHDALVRAAHEEGSLRPDVTAGDISLLAIRFTPSLAWNIPPEVNDLLKHRHLELVLDGLLRLLREDNLPGPAISLAELIEMGPVANRGHPGTPHETHPEQLGRRRDRNS